MSVNFMKFGQDFNLGVVSVDASVGTHKRVDKT